jgi:hypothetical protein
MLVLALQFSRDRPIARQVRVEKRRLSTGNDRKEGAELLHNGTGTPGDSGSGGAIQRSFQTIGSGEGMGSEVIRIAE